MCIFVEKYSQTIFSSLNILMLNFRKKAKTFKFRNENNLSLRRRRYLTKTINTNFEIKNTSRSKL